MLSHMIRISQRSLELEYTPKMWKRSKVIFMPKARKSTANILNSKDLSASQRERNKFIGADAIALY